MLANTLELVDACDLNLPARLSVQSAPGYAGGAYASSRQTAARAPRGCGAAGEAALARYLRQQVGAHVDVLAEKDGFSRSEQFAPVRMDRAVTSGTVLRARVHGTDGRTLFAGAEETGAA